MGLLWYSKSTEIITGTSSLNSLKSSITPTSSQITQEPVTTNPYVDTGQTDHTTTVISQSDKTQAVETSSAVGVDIVSEDMTSAEVETVSVETSSAADVDICSEDMNQSS
jgi:hypothetical protein